MRKKKKESQKEIPTDWESEETKKRITVGVSEKMKTLQKRKKEKQ